MLNFFIVYLYAPILWSIGYGISAGFKQFLSLILIGNQSGTKKLAGWIAGGIKVRIRGILIPFTRFIYKPLFAFIVLFVLTVVILLTTKKIKIDLKRSSAVNMMTVIFPAFLLPIICFLFLSKAADHGFYVQNLGSSLFALLFTTFSLIQKREINE